MYQIKCDDFHLYDYRLPDLIVTDPKVKIAVNTVGEASFTIHNNHPYYSQLKVLRSIFEISDEIGVIFRGRMTNNSQDFHNSKAVDLEGLMAFFNDSVVRPFNFPDDFKTDPAYITASQSGNVVRYMLQLLIDNHNSQVEDFQKFKLGNVTVSDPNNYITRSESKYCNTWEILKTKLFESALGGYLCIRYEADGNYIDYLSEFELTNTQEIQYGENLIDLKNEIDAASTYSAIIPLGAEVETSETDENGEKVKKTLTLSGLADGTVAPNVMKKGDVIYSPSAVADFGWICAPVTVTTWQDVTEVNNLLKKGIEYLTGEGIKLQNNIEINAVDLHFNDAEIRSFRLYRNIKVNSLPHNQNALLPLTLLDIDLLRPQNTKIVVGKVQKTLSEITNDRYKDTLDHFQSVADDLKGKVSVTQSNLNDLTTKVEGAIEGTFLYIMYSPYEDGHEMTTDPDENTMYMGTCSTNSAARPTDHTKYTWVKVRGLEGERLQVKYLNSATTPTITNNDVSAWLDKVPAPEKGKRTYMIQKLSGETLWSTPIQISGEDGDTPTVSISENGYWIINGEETDSKAQGETPNITVGANGNWFVDGEDTGTKAQGEQGKDGADIEYVYYRSKTAVTNLSAPTYTNGTLTSNWTASPQGITETYKYEYVSVRKKTAGSTSWGKFSTPIIWSKWGEKGTDGDGIEYKYYLKNNSTKPTYSASDSKWTDDPTGVSENNMYEYVVQITHHGDGTKDTVSAVSLWAKWGETGEPGQKGEDGRTQYWHIKYSDDGGVSFTDNGGETLGAWIGTYVDFNETDSTEPKDYTWKKFTEDVDDELDDIRTVISSQHTDIQRTEGQISLIASRSYVETSAFDQYKEEVSSEFTQSAEDITMQFTTTTEQISNVNGDLQSKFEKISKHISFNENGISIGGGSNAMLLTVDNDNGIIFSKNGVPFGWWDGVDFHTGNIVVEVNERAQFGNFAFVPRSDGSLSFLKVGGSSGDAHTHNYIESVLTAATCTNTGTKTKLCSSCGDSSQITIPALGHNYTSVVTAPTATAQGYTTYTCTRCGDSYKDNYTDATGCQHTSTATRYETTSDATCTTAGSRNKVTYCTSCGAVIGSVPESIPATGQHIDSNGDGKCDVCGTSTGSSGGTVGSNEVKLILSVGGGSGLVDFAYEDGTALETTEMVLPLDNKDVYIWGLASEGWVVDYLETYRNGAYEATLTSGMMGSSLMYEGRVHMWQPALDSSDGGSTLEVKYYFKQASSGVLVSGDTIAEGAEVSVSLPVKKEYVSLYFTPKYSGSYTIKSLDCISSDIASGSTPDPDCFVYDSTGTTEKAKDNNGGAFTVTYGSFVAGTTYLVKIRLYNCTGTLKMSITYNG